MDEKSSAPVLAQAHTPEPPTMKDSASLSGASAYPGNQALLGRRVPIPDPVLTNMEAAFRADLSEVSVIESPLVELAGAEAFSFGTSIFVAPGTDFTSRSGQELLGHELSHIVSHASGQIQGSGFLNDSGLERQADLEGQQAASSQMVDGRSKAGIVTAAGAAGPMQAKGKNRAQAVQSGSVSKTLKNMSFLDWGKMLFSAGNYGRYAHKEPQALDALGGEKFNGLDVFGSLDVSDLEPDQWEQAVNVLGASQEGAKQIRSEDAERSDMDLDELKKQNPGLQTEMDKGVDGFQADTGFNQPMPVNPDFRLGVYVVTPPENYLQAQKTRTKYKLMGKKDSREEAWADTLKGTITYRNILERKKARAKLKDMPFEEETDPDLQAYRAANSDSDPDCGHTFLKFDILNKGEGGGIAKRYSFGFWPQIPVRGPLSVVPGEVRNPDPHTNDTAQVEHRDYNIDQYSNFAKMAAHVRGVAASHRSYSFTGYNCTSFAADVAEQGGISLPSYMTMTTIRQLRQKVDSPAALAANLGMFSEDTTQENFEARVNTYVTNLQTDTELATKLALSPYISALSQKYEIPIMAAAENCIRLIAAKMTPGEEEAEGIIALHGKDPQFALDDILFHDSKLKQTMTELGLAEQLDKKLGSETAIASTKEILSQDTELVVLVEDHPGLLAMTRLEGITSRTFLDRLSDSLNQETVKRMLNGNPDSAGKKPESDMILSCLKAFLNNKALSPVDYFRSLGNFQAIFQTISAVSSGEQFIEDNKYILSALFDQHSTYQADLILSGQSDEDYFDTVIRNLQSRFSGSRISTDTNDFIAILTDSEYMENFLMNMTV